MCHHGDTADPYVDLVGAAERFVARTHTPDRTLDQAQQDLVRQCRLMDLLRLNIAREAAAVDDALRATDDAHTSLIPFLTHDCRMAAGEASNALCVGQQMATLERSVDAVHEGGIGFAHLALMAHTKQHIEVNGARLDETRLLKRARVTSPTSSGATAPMPATPPTPTASASRRPPAPWRTSWSCAVPPPTAACGCGATWTPSPAPPCAPPWSRSPVLATVTITAPASSASPRVSTRCRGSR